MRVITYLPALVGVLMLGGCQTTGSTQWVKYGPGPDYDYAKAKCEIGAMGVEQGVVAWGSPGYVLGAQLGNAIGNEIRKAEFTDRCMVMHGWKRMQVQPGTTGVQQPVTAYPANYPATRVRPSFDPGRPPSRLIAGQ